MKLLDGFLVVDLGVGMAPALVTKYLAEAGARVVRVEPEGGDPFYDYYPAYKVWHGAAEAGDAAQLGELLARADICVLGGEDYPGLTRRKDADAIAAAHPRLVVLEITGNPQGTEDADAPSNELLAQARSGLAFEHFTRRPIYMGFQPANYGAALQGLCAVLAAVYEREASGKGQIARTSLFEGSLTWVGMAWADFERPTKSASFVNPKDPTPLVFRCRDGAFIHFVIGGAGSKYKLYQILGIDDPTVLPNDNGMPDINSPVRNFYGNIDLLTPYVARRDSQELLEALWQAGLPAEPVLPPGGCWDYPQVAHNGVLARDEDGSRHVGNPIIAKISPGNGAPQKPASGKRPLEGVRILDFGAYVAGPVASVVLSDLGADVIKVEPITGDPSRAMFRGYMVANRGKRGLAVDLKSPAGIALAQEMATGADIVCNNFRSGVSVRLGIDPAHLQSLKPDLIALESPAYGSSGPLSQRAGFDMVMQALCGHEVRAGGQGNEPFWNRNSYVDFAGGMLGALALLTALVFRARTGNGVALDVPLFNGGLFLMSELIQKADGSFIGAEPINSTRTGRSPSEAMYEAADGWLALFAPGAAAGKALAETLGLAGQLPADPVSWGEPEAGLIAEAVSGCQSADLAAALTRVGVWAQICRRDIEQIVLHSPIARVTNHATLGRIREVGPLYRLSRSALGNDLPIHGLGEHTREILREQKRDAGQIEELVKTGAVA